MLLQWSCDWCGTLLEPLSSRHVCCPGCGYVHQVPDRGRPALSRVSVVAEGTLEPVAGSHCAAHPDATAVGTCERCGDFACRSCARVIQGRRYCTPCVELQSERREVGQRARWPEHDARSALVLAALGLFYPACGLLLGAPAAWLALTALRSVSEEGLSYVRWRAYAALGMVSLSLLLSAVWVWLVWL